MLLLIQYNLLYEYTNSAPRRLRGRRSCGHLQGGRRRGPRGAAAAAA